MPNKLDCTGKKQKKLHQLTYIFKSILNFGNINRRTFEVRKIKELTLLRTMKKIMELKTSPNQYFEYTEKAEPQQYLKNSTYYTSKAIRHLNYLIDIENATQEQKITAIKKDIRTVTVSEFLEKIKELKITPNEIIGVEKIKKIEHYKVPPKYDLRLKYMLLYRGITKAELCLKTKIEMNIINFILEKGMITRSIEKVIKMCEVLNFSTDFLLGTTNKLKPFPPGKYNAQKHQAIINKLIDQCNIDVSKIRKSFKEDIRIKVIGNKEIIKQVSKITGKSTDFILGLEP